jgi:hypothetical protein
MRVATAIASRPGGIPTPSAYRRSREHRLLVDALTGSGVLPPDLAEMATADDAAQPSASLLECAAD